MKRKRASHRLRRDLQEIQPTKDWYPSYIKNSPKLIRKKQPTFFLNEQKTYTDTTQKGYLNG